MCTLRKLAFGVCAIASDVLLLQVGDRCLQQMNNRIKHIYRHAVTHLPP